MKKKHNCHLKVETKNIYRSKPFLFVDMKLTEEDRVKLQSYLKTKVGRPDSLVSELRKLLQERAKNKDGKFVGEDAIRNLGWIYDEGAKKIRDAPTWEEVKQIMSLIFDVDQPSGFGLIKNNKELKKEIKLKVQVWGVPAPNSHYFDQFKYTMSLMGIKVPSREVKRPPRTIKKPRLGGIFGNLFGLKEVVVESDFYDTIWNVPSKEEILAQL